MSTVDLLPDPVEAAAALNAPSERAQEIYYQAVVESRSQREIAKEFNISQPRVNQIVAKVLAWVGDTLPGAAGEMTARQRFQAAKQITRDRLMYYPGLLVEKFHQSCEPIQVQITKPGCEPEFKIKQGQPKPQLLKAAADIAAKLPRFEAEMLIAEQKMIGPAIAVPPVDPLSPTPTESFDGAGDNSPAPAEHHPAPATVHPSPAAHHPLDGDLSAIGQDQPVSQPAPSASSAAKPFNQIPYRNLLDGNPGLKDFPMPPKNALSRHEIEIDRRRQKAANKKERRRLAALA